MLTFYPFIMFTYVTFVLMVDIRNEFSKECDAQGGF